MKRWAGLLALFLLSAIGARGDLHAVLADRP
jgi:hypothetical protein